MTKRLIENVELTEDDGPNLKRPVTWDKSFIKKVHLKPPLNLEDKTLEFNLGHSNDTIWKLSETMLVLKLRKGYLDGAGAFQRGHDPSTAVHARDAFNAIVAGQGNPAVPLQAAREASISVRWINGIGLKIIKNIQVKPDGGNNIEETPTDTRIALESWQTYLHMYDEEEKKNKVLRDQFMVDERLLKHENPHVCGISADRENYRNGANYGDVQNVAPLTDEQKEMLNFEQQQYWR